MSYQLTNEDLEQIQETLDTYYAGTVIRYSGRAMYGDTCLGIVTDNVAKTCLKLGALHGDSDTDLSVQLLRQVRTDFYGQGEVVYFPYVILPAGFVTEEDEDNE